jgi:glutathione S-transferase
MVDDMADDALRPGPSTPPGTEPLALTLYHRPSCSYCVHVRMAAERMGIPLELRDVRQEPRWREELIAVRGRGTVPVLRIDHADGTTRWLPESLDIIRYLKTLADQPDPVPRWLDRLLKRAWTLSWLLSIVGLVTGGFLGPSLRIGNGIPGAIAFYAGMAGLLVVVGRRITAVLSARPR